MPLNASTLRPGLLVPVKTSIKGNVRYDKKLLDVDTDAEVPTEDAELSRWETLRTIYDKREYERASKARSRARSIIRNVCIDSGFGLLCPEEKSDKLDAAITEARGLVEEFNLSARYSRIELNVLIGRIEPDSVRAIQAINSEVRDLLDLIKDGIQRLDVKAVREAASRARAVGQMLSPEAQARVGVAIDEARAFAREFVKAGEVAAQEIDKAALDAIAQARTAFLDLDEAGEVALPEAEGRAVDFDPSGLSAGERREVFEGRFAEASPQLDVA